jgi:TPR repeat protein
MRFSPVLCLIIIIADACLIFAASVVGQDEHPALPAVIDFQTGLEAYKRGDYATALKEWRPLAENGDAQAQFQLGVMYHNGEGVQKDDKEAVKWFCSGRRRTDRAGGWKFYYSGYEPLGHGRTSVAGDC